MHRRDASEIGDLVLNYHPDWPRGQVRFAEARFRNGGMSALARDGRPAVFD